MSEDLTEEEQKDPQYIRLNMKPYNPQLNKTTAFFTDYAPEQILKELTDSLSGSNTEYQISDKTWKVTFVKNRDDNPEEAEEGQIILRE
jgi:hypothetical protein